MLTSIFTFQCKQLKMFCNYILPKSYENKVIPIHVLLTSVHVHGSALEAQASADTATACLSSKIENIDVVTHSKKRHQISVCLNCLTGELVTPDTEFNTCMSTPNQTRDHTHHLISGHTNVSSIYYHKINYS